MAGNPCIEYIKYITMPWFGKFEVVRPESNGGNKVSSRCLLRSIPTSYAAFSSDSEQLDLSVRHNFCAPK